MSRIQPMYDSIKLNIAITSDNHIDIRAKNNSQRIKTIKKVLGDVQNSTAPVDAYITVGDMTSRGITENWETVKECFKGFKPAKQMFFALGNHDCWSEKGFDGGYDDAIENYYKYLDEICSFKTDKPYFSKVINGYRIIFLGNTCQAYDEDCAALGKDELEWLDCELKEASADGKPIFIFCHQSINNNHGLPKTWDENEKDWEPEIGGIGSESDELKKVITQYKNVFYFSGHSHMGLCGEKSLEKNGYASFEQHDGVNYINTPCLTRENHHGETKKTGFGYLLEVYDGKVVIRPRNFRKKKMNRKIKIKDGKPFLEITL